MQRKPIELIKGRKTKREILHINHTYKQHE